MLLFPSQTLLKQVFKKDISPQGEDRKEDNNSKILEAGKHRNLANLRKTVLKCGKPRTKPVNTSQYSKRLKIGTRYQVEMVYEED